MVQQVDAQLHQYLQVAKRAICLALYKGHSYKKSTMCLMSINQRNEEMLRSYITCFNKKALSINEADDKILVAAFTNGLRKGKFLFSLYKNDLKTMSNVLYRATKYMNTEDALLAQEEKPKKRERQEDARQDRGRKMAKTGDRRENGRSKPPTGRFISFTPLTASIDQVLMQIKDEGALTFLGKLKGNSSKRSRDKYCHFHYDHGHDTSDYYDFLGEIRMIVEGTTTSSSSRKARKTYLRIVQNVQLTGFVPKMAQIYNPVIGFTKEDARRLHHPHDDALIVSIRVGNYNTHRVLVDNGSSVDILYYLAFQ